MWKFDEDKTKPVLSAQKHIESAHKAGCKKLPDTAVLFYMHSGVDYILNNYNTELITEKFPRFLNSCPIYGIKNCGICILDGGRGAPQAVDTIETLARLKIKNVIAVGMFGAFDKKVNIGDIVIPSKAFVEEGTSLHYYSSIDYAEPDFLLHKNALSSVKNAKSYPIVSTDAVYRQTYFKENLWRNKGAVGVDMETSALFSVGKYLGLNVVSILIASDKHPQNENDSKWKWNMTRQMRYAFFEKCMKFALGI